MSKCGRCVGLSTLPYSCADFLKSGSLSPLHPSGPVQACNGVASPLPFTTHYTIKQISRNPSWMCFYTNFLHNHIPYYFYYYSVIYIKIYVCTNYSFNFSFYEKTQKFIGTVWYWSHFCCRCLFQLTPDEETHNGNMAKCFYHVLLKQARLGLIYCGFLKTITTKTDYVASNRQGAFELP
jgi:hypothetical protein